MPQKETNEEARKDLREGKRPKTAAAEFVREEIERGRRGKHGMRLSRRPTASSSPAGTRSQQRYWSQAVTESSNALDLEAGVFTMAPRQMALSLKRSAERSTRRKSSPFRSAMSMLTFYQNRAGSNLSAERKRAIQEAKDELRKLYGREPT